MQDEAMTAIATDGKSMAGDGLMTGNGAIFSEEEVKVHRLKNGSLVGVCGNSYNAPAFVAWLDGGEEKPELTEDFEALVLLPDGTCRSYDNKLRHINVPVPTATGSGQEFAMGAMAVGASPEDAVKAACERCTNCGGKITVLHIDEPPALRAVA
jgi:ATP-dependent protease HslVU (ClpYQ) peptidase subunit